MVLVPISESEHDVCGSVCDAGKRARGHQKNCDRGREKNNRKHGAGKATSRIVCGFTIGKIKQGRRGRAIIGGVGVRDYTWGSYAASSCRERKNGRPGDLRWRMGRTGYRNGRRAAACGLDGTERDTRSRRGGDERAAAGALGREVDSMPTRRSVGAGAIAQRGDHRPREGLHRPTAQPWVPKAVRNSHSRRKLREVGDTSTAPSATCSPPRSANMPTNRSTSSVVMDRSLAII